MEAPGHTIHRLGLDIWEMKKLRIGYQALSSDLSHPGDRRRVVFWAKKRGHQIVTNLNERVDVIVLSEKTNFGIFPNKALGIPTIFDLIDGYLSPENLLDDWMRGTAKVMAGQLSTFPQPFTRIVRRLCREVDAVICSTPEQLAVISPLNSNIHVILDSHDELPFLTYQAAVKQKIPTKQILWEGMPATLGGLAQVTPSLISLHSKLPIRICFVTDQEYFEYIGKYRPRKTTELMERILEKANAFSYLRPWNKENLIDSANASSLSIIPIQLSSSLQFLKPENRLLIMWRLGLPCLTSATPAYMRVSNAAESNNICKTEEDWTSKIEAILKSPDYAEIIVKRGQSYIKEFLNTDTLLEQWDHAIESVI